MVDITTDKKLERMTQHNYLTNKHVKTTTSQHKNYNFKVNNFKKFERVIEKLHNHSNNRISAAFPTKISTRIFKYHSYNHAHNNNQLF